jgi:hypothetical protein
LLFRENCIEFVNFLANAPNTVRVTLRRRGAAQRAALYE